MNMASKMPNKVVANRIQRYRYTHHDQVVFVPEMREWFNICKSTNVISRKKMDLGKNHMFISITAKKAFGKIQPAFTMDIPENGTKGSTSQHNKGYRKETCYQHHSNWRNQKQSQ